MKCVFCGGETGNLFKNKPLCGRCVEKIVLVFNHGSFSFGGSGGDALEAVRRVKEENKRLVDSVVNDLGKPFIVSVSEVEE